MSLYTITFDDDDDESSDSPLPPPKPINKTPQFKRPLNIVTKPSPKPAPKPTTTNRTTIQRMQMIITDSDSYDVSEIESIPTYGNQLQSVSKEYSDDSNNANSPPRSPKIHVKDMKTDSDYESYSYENDNQDKIPEIKTQNAQVQLSQNKNQPFQHQSRPRKIIQQSSQTLEYQEQKQQQQQQQPQPQIQQPQEQQQPTQQQNHQQSQLPLRQKSQSQKIQNRDLNQNQNFNQAEHKNEPANQIANSQPEFPPDDLLFQKSSVPRNNFNKPLVPYRLQRTFVHSIRGKRTHFQLYKGGVPILHTKVKQGKVDELCITEGTETHFKEGNFKAVFLCANQHTSFSLREKSPIGKELMVIRYSLGGENEPRNVFVHFSDLCGRQIDFQNRKARLTSHNIWILDLKGRIALKSIKNCVVVDENNEEVMIVIKTELDTLNIEAREEISDLEAMAMVLSSFLCKK